MREQQPRLVERGLLRTLEAAVRGGDPRAQEAAARSLALLAQTEELRRTLAAEGVFAVLALAAGPEAATAETQLHAARALADLTHEEELKVQLVQAGCLEQLVSLAKSRSVAVRLQVASALHNLIQNEAIATKIMQEFGFPLFTSLADVDDLEVQHLVERCLARLNVSDAADVISAAEEYCVIPDDQD